MSLFGKIADAVFEVGAASADSFANQQAATKATAAATPAKGGKPVPKRKKSGGCTPCQAKKRGAKMYQKVWR